MAHEPYNSADDGSNRRQGHPFVAIGGGFLLLVVFYVLSPIPVRVLIVRLGLLESTVVHRLADCIYFPLEWAYMRYPLVQQFYDAGYRLFGVL